MVELTLFPITFHACFAPSPFLYSTIRVFLDRQARASDRSLVPITPAMCARGSVALPGAPRVQVPVKALERLSHSAKTWSVTTRRSFMNEHTSSVTDAQIARKRPTIHDGAWTTTVPVPGKKPILSQTHYKPSLIGLRIIPLSIKCLG
jgi:hypothetical protein